MRDFGKNFKETVRQYYGDICLSDEENEIVDKLLTDINKREFIMKCQESVANKCKNTWRFGRFYVSKKVVAAMLICLLSVATFLTVIGIRSKSVNKTNTIEGCGLLPGVSEIYPAVMVNGHIYKWRKGVALIGPPPGKCIYGEINHIDGKQPYKDCDFVSVFSAKGQIYIIPGNSDSVYIRITTPWMQEKYVVFDIVEDLI